MDTAPDRPAAWVTLRSWGPRRWAVALAAGVATVLLVGLPTDVIPNPVFGRPVPVTWWSLPVLVVTSALAGLLAATYVRQRHTAVEVDADVDRSARLGGAGGLLAYFAVGCPVCNKLVLLALGATGAVEVFAPLQPILAVAGVVLLAVALQVRLRNDTTCPIPNR